MKHIFKIAKKFTISFILVIVLLAIQANLDLSLPDYTANIINVGIQQNGITESVPEYLSLETYSKMNDYLSDLSNYYELDNDRYILKNSQDSIKSIYVC